ncbi:hypothetical protein ILUMI_21910 [Ignelater luminosus]|uniref:DDE Tnp4 domain-containing protein n=1 Tax=Ignelater luminosus TaxID=2038154 RepID=A0A8K0CBJ9_IGNLU|nr:hypothetical protein ILUMI_21910 [Ignelater luminosus]
MTKKVDKSVFSRILMLNEIIKVLDERSFRLSFRTIAVHHSLAEQHNKPRFYEIFEFAGVIGVIDCTHIAIVAPPAEDRKIPGRLFIRRKGYHSINCQVTCEADLKILTVNERRSGSVHDAAVWSTSAIYQHLKQQYQHGKRSSKLLGDSGYPLQPWLFTPVIGAAANTPRANYNRRLASAKNTIERCIVDRLTCLFHKHAPWCQVTFGKKPAPWLIDNIKLLMKLRDKAKSKYKDTRTEADWPYYKALRNFTTTAVRNEKKTYLQFKIDNNNTKELWNELRRLNAVPSKSNNKFSGNINEINDYFVNSIPSLTVLNYDLRSVSKFSQEHALLLNPSKSCTLLLGHFSNEFRV